MTLLRWLWIAQWRMQPGRALTAIVAVAIGVALALAIHLVNRSALEQFSRALSVVNGEAQLQVKGRIGPLDDRLFDPVATADGVRAAGPVVDIEVSVDRPRPGAEAGAAGTRSPTLRILGIDLFGAQAVTPSLMPAPARPARDDSGAREPGNEARRTDARDDTGDSLLAADAIFLSAAAQAGLDLRPGDAVVVRYGDRRVGLRVAGDLPGAGAGQPLGVMDVAAAQWQFGWIGRLSRIDLRLTDDQDITGLQDRLRPLLGGEAVLSTPAADEQRMSNLSRAYRVNLNVLALIALVTGAFIVHSTMALSIVRQQHDLALLGILGMSPRQLLVHVLGQGALLGAIGSLIGLATGIGLAVALLEMLGGDLGGGYFRGSRPPLAIDAVAIVAFGVLGFAAGIAGSLVPAWAIARAAPARALKSGAAEQTLRSRHAGPIAAVLAITGALLVMLPPIAELPLPSYAAIACWLVAGIAVVPVVNTGLGHLLARFAARAWPHPSAWLALQRVRRTPGGAAAALAGVIASVALGSAMAIMVSSFRHSLDDWLGVVLPADLYGRLPAAGAGATLDDAAFAPLASLPGVARIDTLRAVEMTIDPARPPAVLLARRIDGDDPARQLPITGELQPAPAGTIAVFVSEAMVDLYGWRPGTRVSLPLAGGQSDGFFVAGVWRDYARQHGAVAIDRDAYRRLTGDSKASDLAIWLAAGADPAAVLAAVRSQPTAVASMEFRSSRELRELSLAIFDRSFTVTYVLEAVAILVALFGVAATFAGEALARSKEFGMLRHLGLRRADVATVFGIEASWLSLVAVGLGTVLGAAIAQVLIHRVNPQSFHWTMQTTWPVGLLAGSGLALVVLGVVAAVTASRHATAAGAVRAVREDW